MSWFVSSGGQSIETSASASADMNTSVTETQNERVLRYFLMYEIVKLEELGAGYIET